MNSRIKTAMVYRVIVRTMSLPKQSTHCLTNVHPLYTRIPEGRNFSPLSIHHIYISILPTLNSRKEPQADTQCIRSRRITSTCTSWRISTSSTRISPDTVEACDRDTFALISDQERQRGEKSRAAEGRKFSRLLTISRK